MTTSSDQVARVCADILSGRLPAADVERLRGALRPPLLFAAALAPTVAPVTFAARPAEPVRMLAAPPPRDRELEQLTVKFQAAGAGDHAALAEALAEHRELRARGMSSLSAERYCQLALERARRA